CALPRPRPSSPAHWHCNEPRAAAGGCQQVHCAGVTGITVAPRSGALRCVQANGNRTVYSRAGSRGPAPRRSDDELDQDASGDRAAGGRTVLLRPAGLPAALHPLVPALTPPLQCGPAGPRPRPWGVRTGAVALPHYGGPMARLPLTLAAANVDRVR